MEKRINSFFQGMGMGVNSFFKSRNEEWELIPFFKKEWEWDYNPKNEGMDPCLPILHNFTRLGVILNFFFFLALFYPFKKAFEVLRAFRSF